MTLQFLTHREHRPTALYIKPKLRGTIAVYCENHEKTYGGLFFNVWIGGTYSNHWLYSPECALACRTMSFHFFLSVTNSLQFLTPSTWRSLSTSSFHSFLGLPLHLVPSSSWVNIFLGILSSSILSRWPNQLIVCPFIHFTIISPLLISSNSWLVLLFHSPFSYLGPYILLCIFVSKISRACSSFFIIVHVSTPYDTTDLISVLYNWILSSPSIWSKFQHYIWYRVVHSCYLCML